MPQTDIAFTVSIPIREEDKQQIIDAFLQEKPYNTSYQPQVEDFAGNTIDNPITPLMYVEDCVAYYIMDITKNYLVNKATIEAREIAQNQTTQLVNQLRSYIDQNSNN